MRFRDGRSRSASTLASLVQGVLHGPDLQVSGVAPLDQATPDDLAFHLKGEPGKAGLIFTRKPLPDRTSIVVADPLLAMSALVEQLFPETPERLLPHPSGAFIAADAQVHPSVVLHSGVCIGARCVVGEGTVLFPNVVLYPDTRIGRGARIHANAVIGADGFRYHPTPEGPRKVPHAGGVRIGDLVEIGAGTCVDRGFLTDTVIGDGCKIDNLVQIGHNCVLGRFVIIAGQAGISGSCTIGDGVLIAGQVGLADHLTIGAGARIGAKSAVHTDIPVGETWVGMPARPIRESFQIMAAMRYLPDIWKKVRSLA